MPKSLKIKINICIFLKQEKIWFSIFLVALFTKIDGAISVISIGLKTETRFAIFSSSGAEYQGIEGNEKADE